VKNQEQLLLHRRHNLVRWVVGAIALIVIGIYEGLELNWPATGVRSLWNTLDVLFLAIIGAFAYFSVDRILRLIEGRAALKDRLAEAEKALSEARRRQSTVVRLSQMFLDASDEDEVVDLALNLSRELLGARGAAFVPLDENAQPLGAKSLGDIPFSEASAWLEYLASPGVREACAACNDREQVKHSCPLLVNAFQDATGVYCIPLRRDEQDFGILNLFFPPEVGVDADAQDLLKTIVDESTIAIESVRMRQKAMTTLRQIQSLREKTDLNSLLKDLIEGLRDTLEADFVLVTLQDEGGNAGKGEISVGAKLPENARYLVDGILQSVKTSHEPVLLENAAGSMASSAGMRAIVAAPLLVQEVGTDDLLLGVILAASRRARAFNQRQLSILQMIAGQVSLVIQNVRLVAQLEYKTMIEERMRLAREIHDGLAQTLGFLKLKTAQMRNYIELKDDELLREAVDTSYNVLSEAYQDARQAIDGLRISSKDGFGDWLQQTVEEFQEYSGAVVTVYDPEIVADLPPEVNAQLIRIIQEALSNVRKHSGAKRVEITCRQAGGEIILEICDDGMGFNVEDVPGPSQHGLRGMRERAELIEADLQVISQSTQGTIVRLKLPLQEMEGLT